MNRLNLVSEIVDKLNNNYSGSLNCEEQRADLFVTIGNYEEKIVAIDTEKIYFENEENNVDLVDADIRYLTYIKEVI